MSCFRNAKFDVHNNNASYEINTHQQSKILKLKRESSNLTKNDLSQRINQASLTGADIGAGISSHKISYEEAGCDDDKLLGKRLDGETFLDYEEEQFGEKGYYSEGGSYEGYYNDKGQLSPKSYHNDEIANHAIEKIGLFINQNSGNVMKQSVETNSDASNSTNKKMNIIRMNEFN